MKTKIKKQNILARASALLLILATTTFVFNPTIAQAAESHTKSGSLAPMLKKTIPAVVNIRSEGQLPPVIYLQKQSNTEEMC